MNFWDWLIKEGENPLTIIGPINPHQASARGPFVFHFPTVKDWLEAKREEWYKIQGKQYTQSYLRKNENGIEKLEN